MSRLSAAMRIVLTRPAELPPRVRGVAETYADRLSRDATGATVRQQDWDALVSDLSEHLEVDLAAFTEDAQLASLGDHIASRLATLPGDSPIGTHQNSGTDLARLQYALTRALRPLHVVETGVALGISSSHILLALQQNEQGLLHSVDLPPARPGAESFVGHTIPAHLRTRWRLHRGSSRRVLPTLLETLGSIDLFIHDGLHTRSTMAFEFDIALRHLSPHGVLLSDDVHHNSAFARSAESVDCALASVCSDGTPAGLFGVIIPRGH